MTEIDWCSRTPVFDELNESWREHHGAPPCVLIIDWDVSFANLNNPILKSHPPRTLPDIQEFTTSFPGEYLDFNSDSSSYGIVIKNYSPEEENVQGFPVKELAESFPMEEVEPLNREFSVLIMNITGEIFDGMTNREKTNLLDDVCDDLDFTLGAGNWNKEKAISAATLRRKAILAKKAARSAAAKKGIETRKKNKES